MVWGGAHEGPHEWHGREEMGFFAFKVIMRPTYH